LRASRCARSAARSSTLPTTVRIACLPHLAYGEEGALGVALMSRDAARLADAVNGLREIGAYVSDFEEYVRRDGDLRSFVTATARWSCIDSLANHPGGTLRWAFAEHDGTV
jgi:hypothetical protein